MNMERRSLVRALTGYEVFGRTIKPSQAEDMAADLLALMARPRPCIFDGCVSTDRHWHGPFPGGYDNPDNPNGPPIPFTSEPEPGTRDHNGALLGRSPESDR